LRFSNQYPIEPNKKAMRSKR